MRDFVQRTVRKISEIIFRRQPKEPLPPGDSPSIALQIQYGLTMGDWRKSGNKAHVEAHHQTVDEIKADILTEQEETDLGDVLNSIYMPFAQLLSRPGLKNPAKSFKDLWFTGEIADRHPNLRFQYDAIQTFKEAMVIELARQARAGTLPAKIIKHWQGPDALQVIGRFTDLAVKQFFTGNRWKASMEFQERYDGTYGLFIEDGSGITLISSNQDVIFGIDSKRKMAGFASSPYPLFEEDLYGNQYESLIYMDGTGKGEIADMEVSPVTGELHLKLYSLNRERYATPDEIHKRQYPLEENNPKYKRMHKYKNEERRMMEDVEMITAGIAEGQSVYKQKTSVNYQAGEEMLHRLAALNIERRIFDHVSYQGVFPRIHKQINILAEQCLSAATCKDEHKMFLQTEALLEAEKDSILMRIIRQRLSKTARTVAAMLIDKELDSPALGQLIPAVIAKQAAALEGLLSMEHIDEIYKQWDQAREQLPLPSPKESMDMLLAGYENSFYIPKIAEEIYHALLPGLKTHAISSNDLLDWKNLKFDINSAKVALISSKFGANFPSRVSVNLLANAIGMENVFGMTSRLDSPLSVALGQQLRPESPLIRRVFVTGNYYPAETATLSEILLLVHHVELAFSLAERLNELFPAGHPFGLTLTDTDRQWLQKFRRSMLEDAQRTTGRDGHGRQVQSQVEQDKDKFGNPVKGDVHELLTKRATKFAGRFLEGFITKGASWAYVIGISVAGALWFSGISPFIAALEGIFTLGVVGYLIPLLYRRGILKWYYWDRIGPPPNINMLGILDPWAQVQSLFFSKLFSQAYASMSSQVHDGEYKNALWKLAHRILRGSWIFGHIPTNPAPQDTSKSTLGQLKTTRTSALGVLANHLKSGGHAFTTSRRPFVDHNKSDNNIVIGGEEFVPPLDDPNVSEGIRRVYDIVVDPFGGYLAQKVEGATMAEVMSLWYRLWNPEKTYGEAGSHTTQTSQAPPKEMPRNGHHWDDAGDVVPAAIPDSVPRHHNGSSVYQEDQEGVLAGGADAAAVASAQRKGGIDMNNRWMDFKVKEDPNSRMVFDDGAMLSMPIDGIVPQVFDIVPVTPMMLKSMLGEPNLN